MNYLTIRRADLLKNQKADGVDAYAVGDATNLEYLSGIDVPGFLVVAPKHLAFVCDDEFSAEVADALPDCDVVIRKTEQSYAAAAGEVLKKLGTKAVGVDAVTTSVADFDALAGAGLAVRAVRDRVSGLRVVKDAGEVSVMREAVRIAERAFAMLRVLLREDDTEKESADALDSYVRRAGARASAFPPLVAVGERTALPNPRPGSRRIGDGSKLLVEWGVDVGYKCALSRTIRSPFPVTPTRKTKAERAGQDFDEVAEAVLAAHKAALAAIRSEVPVTEVHTAAQQVIADAGYADSFLPRLGHGIGLQAVEAPTLSATSAEVLRHGMVLVLTTGVAMPGWGAVRVGDTVLVTKEGCTPLTTIALDPTDLGD
jgi:Xaa-Pro aminopeptidase